MRQLEWVYFPPLFSTQIQSQLNKTEYQSNWLPKHAWLIIYNLYFTKGGFQVHFITCMLDLLLLKEVQDWCTISGFEQMTLFFKGTKKKIKPKRVGENETPIKTDKFV